MNRQQLYLSLFAVTIAASPLSTVAARAQVTRGFDQVADAYTSGEERNRQQDLWVMEVHMKPMRMITVPITDPETGDTAEKQVWYLAYKATTRPIESQDADSDTAPVNVLDAIRQPPKFIPEFTLITYDDPAEQIPVETHVDRILPEAVAAINQREVRRAGHPPFQHSIAVVQDVPTPAEPGGDDEQWIYGVATWTGVDPETDYFKVILSGFSNGYQIVTGADGGEEIWRKVLIQEFTRLGDRFDPNLREFQFAGPSEWTYRPESAIADPLDASDFAGE